MSPPIQSLCYSKKTIFVIGIDIDWDWNQEASEREDGLATHEWLSSYPSSFHSFSSYFYLQTILYIQSFKSFLILACRWYNTDSLVFIFISWSFSFSTYCSVENPLLISSLRFLGENMGLTYFIFSHYTMLQAIAILCCVYHQIKCQNLF